jgi:hypothetical protein
MNCIAGALLHFLQDESSSFYMFASIITCWDLQKLFEPGLPDLLLREFQFNYYAKLSIPDLHSHFKSEGITTGFFMSRWYLTIFSVYLPVEVCLRVWDCVFFSKWKAILKVSLALMLGLRDRLAHMDKASVSAFLRDNHRAAADSYTGLLPAAYAVKVKNSRLAELKEQFFLKVADYKLHNLDPYFTNDEVNALDQARARLSEQRNENNRRVQEMQRFIEDSGKKIEAYRREKAEVDAQVHELENEIEMLCEKKALFIKVSEEMTEKIEASNRSGEIAAMKNFIIREDLNVMQEKIRNVEERLKGLTREYINKVRNRKDATLKILGSSLSELISEKNKQAEALMACIACNEKEKEEVLRELSTKLAPIALP